MKISSSVFYIDSPQSIQRCKGGLCRCSNGTLLSFSFYGNNIHGNVCISCIHFYESQHRHRGHSPYRACHSWGAARARGYQPLRE